MFVFTSIFVIGAWIDWRCPKYQGQIEIQATINKVISKTQYVDKGCGNKSEYLHLLAVLGKYTDLLPHPLYVIEAWTD